MTRPLFCVLFILAATGRLVEVVDATEFAVLSEDDE